MSCAAQHSVRFKALETMRHRTKHRRGRHSSMQSCARSMSTLPAKADRSASPCDAQSQTHADTQLARNAELRCSVPANQQIILTHGRLTAFGGREHSACGTSKERYCRKAPAGRHGSAGFHLRAGMHLRLPTCPDACACRSAPSPSGSDSRAHPFDGAGCRARRSRCGPRGR